MEDAKKGHAANDTERDNAENNQGSDERTVKDKEKKEKEKDCQQYAFRKIGKGMPYMGRHTHKTDVDSGGCGCVL
jgi:hypothetical protein